MRKTTVYLSDEQLDGLRREAEERGLSQSQLIREGVDRVVGPPKAKKRVFHSMGKGNGPGWQGGWDADELYEHVMGRRRR